jgi:hypothetical protein
MHGRLLKKEMTAWFFRDVLWPWMAAAGVVGGAFFFVPINQFNFFWKLSALGLIWAAAALAAVATVPAIRDICLRTLVKLKDGFNG